VTRTTGLALGAIAAALLATDSRLVGLAPALALLLAAAAVGLRLLDRRPAARTALAVALGVAVVLARVALGGGVAATPAGPDVLPGGDGPWTVRVVALASPRDGSQRFTGGLEDGAGLRLDITAPRYPPVRVGDRVEVRGALRAPPDGPYGAYLARTGVAATLVTRGLRPLAAAADADRLVQGIRADAGDALERALPEPAAGLAAGILIGLRERVDRELAADFTTTGLSHVVAISGWNIALVAGLVAALLGTWPRRRRAVATVTAIALYTILAGASPSVLRAAVMAGVALLARETGRPGTAARALAWAVVLLLVMGPATVADAGFQLSAAATAGLLAWGTPLAARLRARLPRLPGFIVEGLAVSLAAQAATLPIVLLSFGRLAPLSPILNLLVVPLVPLAMATGTLALVGGLLAGAGAPALFATLLGLPGALVIGLMVMLVQTAADLPFAGVTLPPPAGAALGGLAAAMLLVAGARRRISGLFGPQRPRSPRSRPRHGPGTANPPVARPNRPDRSPLRSDRAVRALAIILALVVATAVVAAAARPDGRVHVVALDVGQGDAILVETPGGGRLLVDGGPDPNRLLVALDARIPPWDRRIDLIVVTHPHEDHVGGLPLLVERYRVGRLLEPGMTGPGPAYAALETALARRGLGSGGLSTGDQFALDDVSFRVLWPDRAAVPRAPPDTGTGINNVSIVLLGTFGAQRFLFTGDAEEGIDPLLVARGLPHVDVLKVAHHGSRTATTDALLDAIRPAVALVSVGTKNTYGHPAPATLARLAAHGVATYRTDLDGTLDVALDGNVLSVRTGRTRAPAAVVGAPSAAVGALAGRVDTWPPALEASPGGPRTPGPADTGTAVPYDRADVRSRARRRRRPAPLAPAAGVAPSPRPGRCGDRRVARVPRGRSRASREPRARGGRGPPARRRQGAPRRRPHPGAPPRRALGGMVDGSRARGARGRGHRAPGDAPRRARRGRVAGSGERRGAFRGLRRQAGQPARAADGGPVRRLDAPLPGGRQLARMERRRGDGGATSRRAPRVGRVCARRRHARGGPPAPLDRSCARRGPGGRGRHGRGAGRRRRRGRGGRGPGFGVSTQGRPPLGYFRGDDGYGLEAAAAALGRDAAAGGPPLTPWHVSGTTTRVAEITERVATATLFGGGTLVVVDDPSPLLRARADREALLATLGAVAPGNALAFLEPTDGSPRPRRARSLEELEAAVKEIGGDTRQFIAPKEGAMARWIGERAAERRIAIEPAAADLLARRVGGFVREDDVNRRRQGQLAVAELEKLALYRLDAPIRREDVEALVADAIPGSTWALLDAVGSRRTREATDLLDRVLAVSPEPVVLTVLHKRIRDLIAVLDAQQRGELVQDAAREMKMKEYPARKLWEQAHGWRPDELDAALDGLLDLDATLKGETAADARRRRLAFLLWIAEHVAR
jgi:competence protein ComEC